MANIIQKTFQNVVFGREFVEKALGEGDSPGGAKGRLEEVQANNPQGTPTPANYSTFYRIYKQETWVRACVDAIRRTATALGWEIVPKEQLEIVDDEEIKDEDEKKKAIKKELLAFFENPNPEDSLTEILDDVYNDLAIYANAYLEVVTNKNGFPKELWNLDATTMRVKTDVHGYVEKYIQEVDGKPTSFEPHEVIHIRMISKGKTKYGLSPIETLILTVDTDLKAQIYTKKYYENYGAPKGLFKMKNATPEQVRRNRLYLATQVAGIENAHRHLMLEGDVEYQPLSNNFKDTESLKVRRYLRDEIIAVFGVPPSKISIIESGNIGGGTGKSQDKTFKEETIYPMQNKVFNKLNKKIVADLFGVKDWIIRPVRENMDDELQRAKINDIYYKDKILDTNEIRVSIGRKPRKKEDTPEYKAEQARLAEEESQHIENDGERSDTPEGATGTKPGGASNFGSRGQGADTETADGTESFKERDKKKKDITALRKNIQENRFLESSKLDRETSELSGKLKTLISRKINRAAEAIAKVEKKLNKNQLAGLLATVKLLFNEEDIADAVEPSLASMYGFSWEAAQEALGVEANPIPEVLKSDIRREALILSKDITDNLRVQITNELINGVNKGEGIYELQQRVKKYLKEPITIQVKASYDKDGKLIRQAHTRTVSLDTWTEGIARYESAKMANSALLFQYKDFGVEKAEWQTTSNPCPVCAPNNGRIFKIQEIESLIPYHVNCQCTWIPVISSVEG